METLLQQTVNGLVVGSVYALIALGYTMVYGILGLINFAHGDVLMVGALVALEAIRLLQIYAPELGLVPTLLAVGGIAALLSPTLAWPEALALAVWQGLVPATLALLLGVVLRRLAGAQALGGVRAFVYVLGRCFLGSALCLFAASTLSQWFGLPASNVAGIFPGIENFSQQKLGFLG